MARDRRLPPAPEAPDLGDPKTVEKLEAAAKHREEERKYVIASILASRQGRALLYQILRDTGLFKDRQITADEYANGFTDGQREVGFNLMRVLARSDPKTFALLLAENDG